MLLVPLAVVIKGRFSMSRREAWHCRAALPSLASVHAPCVGILLVIAMRLCSTSSSKRGPQKQAKARRRQEEQKKARKQDTVQKHMK